MHSGSGVPSRPVPAVLLAAGLAVALAGCASDFDVSTSADPLTRFPSSATFALQLQERASRRLVWSGFARAEVHVGLSREERRARLQRVMAAMLADFPPSQRG